jgi:hypothetical protein
MEHEVVPGRCKIKGKLAEEPCRSRSPKYNFQCLINALSWSNMFCGERWSGRKRQGPRQRNVVITYCYDFFFWGGEPLCTTLPTM